MAKFKQPAPKSEEKSYKARALKSAAGEHMLKKGKEYSIPDEIPADIAEQYIAANLLEKVTQKSNTFSRSAVERETR